MSKLNPKAAAHIKGAQLALVEQALIGFVETILGRSPTDDEILRLGHHMNFAGTPFPMFVKDGKTFEQFYIFNEDVLALGFLDEANPLALSVCRVANDELPVPVAMKIVDERNRRGSET